MGGGLFGSAQTVPTQQNTSQVVNQTGNQATTATQATTANPYALNLANMFGQYIGPSGSLGGGGGIPGQEFFQPYYGGWEQAAGTQQMNFMNQLSPFQGNVPTWLNQGAGLMNEGADIIKTAPNLVNQGAGFMTRSGEAAAAPITGEDVSGFYNPMAGNVTAQLQNIFGQQNLANRLGSTAKMGGVGGDRAAVGMGILANQQGLAAGQTYADLYQRALQAAQQQKAQQVSGMLGAGQGLVGAGGVTGAIGQGVAGVGGQLGQQGLNFGQLQLATNQAAADAARYQAMHPLIQMQMLAQALPGFIGLGQTGAATQATQSNLAGTQTGTGLSQTTYPAPPILPQIAGLGLAGAGLLGKGSRAQGGRVTLPKAFRGGGAVIDLSKDEYQDGGYVDGVDSDSGDLDYGSDGSGDEDRAAADRAAKQRWARAQQALKLLSTTKVFQPNYQKYQPPGIKMPPPPWQLGKFQAGGGVPGMGMARVGSPNRGVYPQALNPTSLLAAARGPYPQMNMPMRGMTGYPRVQEGGRVDADTAHRWGGNRVWRPGVPKFGPLEDRVENDDMMLRGPYRQPRVPLGDLMDRRPYQEGSLPTGDMMQRLPYRGRIQGYDDGGAVMQSPPSPSVSGVQQPQQQPAAPGPMPAAPQNGQQSQPPLPAMGGTSTAAPPPTAPTGGMGNPAQLLTALSIGMMMGSKRYQKGGRVQRMANGGNVGPFGMPPLDMISSMPRPRPLPGMEPLSEQMPHFTGPAGIYEDAPDAPEREAAPNAGRSGDFESSAFTPDDEEGGGGGRPPAPTGGGGGFMGRDASMALMQAGLGMLAASGRRDSRGLPMSGLAAIGAGGSEGLNFYQKQQESARRQQAQAASERNINDLIRHRQAMEKLRGGVDKPITIEGEFGRRSAIRQPDGTYKEVQVTPSAGSTEEAGTVGAFTPEEQGVEQTIKQRVRGLVNQGADPKVARRLATKEVFDQQKVKGGLFDDETTTTMAEQALRGDKSIFVNLSRGVSGPYNLKQVRDRMNQLARAQGMDGADIAALNANFTAQAAAAGVAAKREANIQTAVNEAKLTFPLALDASKEVPRGQFVPFNQLMKMVREKTSSPEQGRLAVALQGTMTAYAQAMSRTGVTTVHAQERAEALLNDVTSHDALKARIHQMELEMNAALVAPEATRKAILEKISGKTPAEPFDAQSLIEGTKKKEGTSSTSEKSSEKSKREEALEWILANPNDPRVPDIKKKLGIQ